MAELSPNILQKLEGGKFEAATTIDVGILQNAEEYNVDLKSLETIGTPEINLPAAPKKENEPWLQLDVGLSDIINTIISSSERPVFLIRDDKLVYLNASALSLLDINLAKDVLGNNFLNLVAKEDWTLLAENIGEMLTNAKVLRIRLKSVSGKIRPITFQAIYLSEIEHFSFILIGEHVKKQAKPTFNNLYDDITGLPNFFLFEDRVQVAVSLENAKENARDENMIMVAAISIDNIETFRKMHIEEAVIKKAANNLVLNLQKSATVALGLKYNFWILLSGLKNKAEVNHEVRKITEILNEGVSDNFTRHELLFSMGVSTYPQPGHSAKKIIEQAIAAIKKAQGSPKSSVEFFTHEEI